MRYPALYLFLFLALSGFSNCFSQTSARVSKPELILENDQLIISYDITAVNQDDIFRVWVKITDANNYKINALALSGDIGDQVSGGTGKKISWNFIEDKVDPETEIFLEVYAEAQRKSVEEPAEIAGDKAEEITETADTELHETRKYSLGKSLYKSALFPGLGFTGINQSKLHLAKGAAGYGLIASTFVFNRLAISNRAKYLASEDISEKNKLYTTYTNQDLVSKVCAYSAIGIWTVEIVWLLIDINAKNRVSDNFPVRIAPGYDPVLGTPTLCLSYQF